jgi:hypothetical protein
MSPYSAGHLVRWARVWWSRSRHAALLSYEDERTGRLAVSRANHCGALAWHGAGGLIATKLPSGEGRCRWFWKQSDRLPLWRHNSSGNAAIGSRAHALRMPDAGRRLFELRMFLLCTILIALANFISLFIMQMKEGLGSYHT